jgi:predicted DNA-binding protein YlxM (UPF0122 family)
MDPTLEQLREYVVMMDQYSAHNFMIYDGHTLQDTPEYQSFKKAYQTSWGAISSIIKQVEDFLQYYEIKLAIVNGPEVFSLAKMNLVVLTRQQIYACLFNMEQIEMYIDSTTDVGGRKLDYNEAIIFIQALVRKCLAKWEYRRLIARIKLTVRVQALVRRFIVMILYK